MHRWVSRVAPALALALAAGLTSCRSYAPRPLVPAEVLARIERARHQTGPAGPSGSPAWLTWPRALEFLRDRDPDLHQARAAFRKAQAVAATPTPWPNPTLWLGPLFGTRLENGASKRIQPFVDLGVTVPLSGRLGHQDAVHEAEARAARVDLVVAHRQACLELRRLYVQWALLAESRTVHQAVLASAERSLALTRRLVDAGQAGALDVGLMELEVSRHRLALLDTKRERLEIEQALSARLGIALERLGDPPSGSELPPVPVFSWPEHGHGSLDGRETLVANHPVLASLRARYRVAERALRLEVSKQYPDLELGASFEGDPGESRKVWGLGLGMAIPILDRNQPGIAAAERERARVRADYEAALMRALAALEGTAARFFVLRQKHRAILDTMLPRSRANLEAALAAIRAGAFDAIRYLEVERAHRTLLIQANEAERAVRQAQAELEAALGVPLEPLADEPAGAYPDLPDAVTRAGTAEENRP